MEAYYATIVAFIREHEAWAAPLAFVLAFGESTAFISVLLPATIILLGIGGVIGASGIGFWAIWTAAALGAAMGGWASYWLGGHFHGALAHFWPLSRHPEMLVKSVAFFRKWGVGGVFLGRLVGPFGSVLPLAAGICNMPQIPFQIANIASALIWATWVLAPGALGIAWLK
ncbi:MAG: DedA family protein [Acetobacteraceae bacterium]|nr:DedA family protein [Acetobacteraceae bacterium]